MKKRILLSLVSFFMMTAMWASLVDAYRIEVSAAAPGKTGATAELTLNMINKLAIGTWQTTLVLPEGVTFVSVATVDGRYPEGYNADIKGVDNGNGTVTIFCEGEVGIALTGTAGAVATVTVEIASTVEPGDYKVIAKDHKLTEVGGTIHENTNEKEYTWTIEQGEEPGISGDLNGDGKVDIADAVSVLNLMAKGEYSEAADLNGDQKVDIADFVSVLNIMAQGGE
jgi:biopolymer transport protein ExbD